MKAENHGTAPIDTDQFAEFAAAVVRQLPRRVHHEVIQAYIENQVSLNELLRRAFELRIISNSKFTIIVNYDVPTKELIDLGEYKRDKSGVHQGITAEQFLPTCKGRWRTKVELIEFSRPTVREEMDELLKREGYVHLDAYELLTLGVERPELQQDSTIVAFGSTFPAYPDCSTFVLALGADGHEDARYLGAFQIRPGKMFGGPASSVRFAVRKQWETRRVS